MRRKQNKTDGGESVMKTDGLAKAVRKGLGASSAALLLSMSPLVYSQGGAFGSVVELSDLDGTDGFVINGIDGGDFFSGDRSGRSVSGAGDINGDGVADLIIGADRADPNGNSDAGESYVVFGGAGTGSTGPIELSSLDGSDGFVINGIDGGAFFGDSSGTSVSGAGDINGDGAVSYTHLTLPTKA